MAPTSKQATPPSSPSHPGVSTKPPSPSTTLQPTSQPSSPQHVHPSDNHQITSMEQSSEHSDSESHTQHNHHDNHEASSTTSNVPNTPETKPMLSHPHDIIPVPESPKNRKPDGPQTMHTNLPDQLFNEKPAIITLAGDNRGTTMHIGSGATKREKSIHILRRYKANPEESTDTVTDDEEEKENDSKPDENEEKSSYINCNIQGINNSMVFNCSITERSPGVHFGSCNENVKKPKRMYIKSTDMKKLKVNGMPSQKQTVRRRCLRGLFMESSESDPNDPHTPRRHGCRYVPGDKSNKDDKTDVV
ncbi:sporozoite surface protein 2-like [Helianthus annuus]|uniref:sporozoite surface protein 2-like n=1 Tax=Helianthus annuus TaxID=4232 RepID=UPI0016531324|nr:sporozoite surface protein 2-like [Helianthus annuus]